jgi:hypothetical protein
VLSGLRLKFRVLPFSAKIKVRFKLQVNPQSSRDLIVGSSFKSPH